MTELDKGKRTESELTEKPLFGVITHGYQPPRVINVEGVFGDIPYKAGYRVVPEINERITHQVYEPLLAEVEKLPPGLITSIYAPLRAYLKHNHPELFAHIVRAVQNTPDKEYAVLGDSLIHAILPLLPVEDQRMLLHAGRSAFEHDFGFFPKGIWLPETAVSHQTVELIAEAGYEFVPLRDDQIKDMSEDTRPDARHNICVVPLQNGGEMTIVLGNKGLSGYVSYDKSSTYDAVAFMEGRRRIEQSNGWNSLLMMDLERYGHHQAGAELFLKMILSLVEQYGFTPLNMRTVMEELQEGKREKNYAHIRDFSSWSCEHECGRWTGNCNCGEFGQAPPEIVADRKQLYENLRDMNLWLNNQLDLSKPGWREDYTEFLVRHYDEICTGENIVSLIEHHYSYGHDNEELTKLLLAKTEVLIGLTSCGWFFGNIGALERTIPASMREGIQKLFPAIFSPVSLDL